MRETKVFCDVCGRFIVELKYHRGTLFLKKYFVSLHIGAYELCKSCRKKYNTDELMRKVNKIVDDTLKHNRRRELGADRVIAKFLKPFFNNTGLKRSQEVRRRRPVKIKKTRRVKKTLDK